MRRLIYMLAAGLLAAGTVLTAVGAASAGATAVRHAGWHGGPGGTAPRHATCTNEGLATVTYVSHKRHITYYLGTPNKLSSGVAAILKPNRNGTTVWDGCAFANGQFLITTLNGGGLALTSRSHSPGADVTVETAGNSGNGFASQHWKLSPTATGTTFQNVKTGLWLRIRNSGPRMYQTVTTGSRATSWTVS